MWITYFRMYAKWLIIIYSILFATSVAGQYFAKLVPVGAVLGNALILLIWLFFIPFGIIETIEREVGIQLHIIPFFRLADMDTFTGLVLLYVANIVFCLIVAVVLAFVTIAWKRTNRDASQG